MGIPRSELPEEAAGEHEEAQAEQYPDDARQPHEHMQQRNPKLWIPAALPSVNMLQARLAKSAALELAGPSSPTLALLLGWTGGSMRHLSKHGPLWHGLGVRTVAATVSVNSTFLPEWATNIRELATELLDCVDAHREDAEMDGQTSRVLPHVFSNGGAMLMLTMLSEARRQGRTLAFDGAVYDSAPSSRAEPYMAPVVIGASGGPDRLRQLAVHVPYAGLAQLLQPVVGTCVLLASSQPMPKARVRVQAHGERGLGEAARASRRVAPRRAVHVRWAPSASCATPRSTCPGPSCSSSPTATPSSRRQRGPSSLPTRERRGGARASAPPQGLAARRSLPALPR